LNLDQGIVFAVLGITLALFVWNRLRFDVVSMLALLAMAFTGLVPADELFSGFGHPAVITVAAVLVISQGLVNGGVVDAIARLLGRIGHRPTLQVLTLTSVVALCSGFINNVGALALLMPVAIWMSRDAGRSPSMLLMPLAFGSLLGGYRHPDWHTTEHYYFFLSSRRRLWPVRFCPGGSGGHRGRYCVYHPGGLASDTAAR
jgi:di/tricarboxylate transporter